LAPGGHRPAASVVATMEPSPSAWMVTVGRVPDTPHIHTGAPRRGGGECSRTVSGERLHWLQARFYRVDRFALLAHRRSRECAQARTAARSLTWTRVYSAVVSRLLRPSSSWTWRTSAPPWSRCVARRHGATRDKTATPGRRATWKGRTTEGCRGGQLRHPPQRLPTGM